jgi:TPR repeat protein
LLRADVLLAATLIQKSRDLERRGSTCLDTEWPTADPCPYETTTHAAQNIPFALELASSCEHPDAQWLAEACAEKTEGDEKFKFAQMAAAQGERDGFHWLGRCALDGEGCKKDLDKAKENFLRASELSLVWAMIWIGELLDDSDPLRWNLWGRAAALGCSWKFWSNFLNQIESNIGTIAAYNCVSRFLVATGLGSEK